MFRCSLGAATASRLPYWPLPNRAPERRASGERFAAMDGAEKVKLALDESRMLALGAQALLGFQLSSVFQQRFDALSTHARTLDAVSLILMVVVLGLLIAPAIIFGWSMMGMQAPARCARS